MTGRACLVPAAAGAVVATPAPGQGSMTVWLDRRGMCGALNTPARHDLRLLWSAARDIAVYKSGGLGCASAFAGSRREVHPAPVACAFDVGCQRGMA